MSTKIVELGSVDDMGQDVVTTTTFTQQLTRRRNVLHERYTPLVLFFDDAQRLVQEGSSLAEHIRITRALNINFVMSLQSSEIAHSIQSNVPTRFLGSTSNAIDSDLLSRGMGNLSYDERRWLSRHLPVGRFLGCSGSDPYVFQVANINWNNFPDNPNDVLTADLPTLSNDPFSARQLR